VALAHPTNTEQNDYPILLDENEKNFMVSLRSLRRSGEKECYFIIYLPFS
jgi:hypothetical protein